MCEPRRFTTEGSKGRRRRGTPLNINQHRAVIQESPQQVMNNNFWIKVSPRGITQSSVQPLTNAIFHERGTSKWEIAWQKLQTTKVKAGLGWEKSLWMMNERKQNDDLYARKESSTTGFAPLERKSGLRGWFSTSQDRSPSLYLSRPLPQSFAGSN